MLHKDISVGNILICDSSDCACHGFIHDFDYSAIEEVLPELLEVLEEEDDEEDGGEEDEDEDEGDEGDDDDDDDDDDENEDEDGKEGEDDQCAGENGTSHSYYSIPRNCD